MAGTFSMNMRRLGAKIGDGPIKGEFHVDGGERTVPLEVGYWRNYLGSEGFKRIRNYNQGGPHAAQRALATTYRLAMEDVAQTVIAEGPQEAMIRHTERVRSAFQRLAPIRTGQYRRSTLCIVRDKGRFAYWKRDTFYGREPERSDA